MSGEHWRALLDAARDAFIQGDPAAAERTAKAVSAMVRAERDLLELAAFAPAQEQDEEALDAELRRRIARLIEAAAAGGGVEEPDPGRQSAVAP